MDSEELARLVPRELADRLHLVPFRLEQRRLSVFVVDPLGSFAADELALLTGCVIVEIRTTAEQLAKRWGEVYGEA